MRVEIIIIGLCVGVVNYLFRYLPVRLNMRKNTERKGRISLILDNIGIASISTLLMVSTVPPVLKDQQKILPILIGFLSIILVYYRFRQIITATFVGAIIYGLAYQGLSL